MKRFLLTPIIVLVVGLFAASLAMGAEQKDHGQSQLNSSMSNQRILIAQTELGVGTASGETQEVQHEYQKLSQEQVKHMQHLLNKQGHNAGPEDGIMGPKTKKALKDFQTSQGIPATGKPDMKTLNALGMSPESAGQMGSQPQEEGVGSASGEGKQ
jgi:murein L,D-transpeptidase YcbB/YkuD